MEIWDNFMIEYLMIFVYTVAVLNHSVVVILELLLNLNYEQTIILNLLIDKHYLRSTIVLLNALIHL